MVANPTRWRCLMFNRYTRFKTIMVWVLALIAVAGNLAAQTEERRNQQSSFEVTEATIPQLQAALRAGLVTSRELVERYTERIEAYDQNGPRLNAIRNLN